MFFISQVNKSITMIIGGTYYSGKYAFGKFNNKQ